MSELGSLSGAATVPGGLGRMDAAEFRSRREWLGVTVDWVAGRLGTDERTVRRWESSDCRVPVRAAESMRVWVASTLAEQAFMETSGFDVLVTFASDEQYDSLEGWSARWHRQLCARVAIATGARVTYV